eukprot:15448947-Alexandrium_andersonii.AAC.1
MALRMEAPIANQNHRGTLCTFRLWADAGTPAELTTAVFETLQSQVTGEPPPPPARPLPKLCCLQPDA